MRGGSWGRARPGPEARCGWPGWKGAAAPGLETVPRERYGEWLDTETREARLVSLLRPYPADEKRVADFGPAVNSPKNDGPECLDAA